MNLSRSVMVTALTRTSDSANIATTKKSLSDTIRKAARQLVKLAQPAPI